jgi:Spy/CpxP family protein refolding chaperone
MNTNNKSRWFGAIIILLLLINAATIIFLLIGKNKHHLPPPQNGGAFGFLVKELALDSNQKNEYQKLRDQHRNSVEGLRTQLKNNKDSLFNLLKKSNVTDENVHPKLDSIASLNRKIDEITFIHFKQVRAICNPQQQMKFDEVIAQAMQIQAPKQEPSHHSPPPNKDRLPREEEPEDGPPPPHN